MWSYVNLVSMKITHLNPTLTTVSILNFAYPDQIGSTVKSNLVSILNIHINLACLNPSLTYLYPSLTFIFNVSNNQIQSTFISTGAYEGGRAPGPPYSCQHNFSSFESNQLTFVSILNTRIQLGSKIKHSHPGVNIVP